MSLNESSGECEEIDGCDGIDCGSGIYLDVLGSGNDYSCVCSPEYGPGQGQGVLENASCDAPVIVPILLPPSLSPYSPSPPALMVQDDIKTIRFNLG